jgi:hypothetical protein
MSNLLEHAERDHGSSRCAAQEKDGSPCGCSAWAPPSDALIAMNAPVVLRCRVERPLERRRAHLGAGERRDDQTGDSNAAAYRYRASAAVVRLGSCKATCFGILKRQECGSHRISSRHRSEPLGFQNRSPARQARGRGPSPNDDVGDTADRPLWVWPKADRPLGSIQHIVEGFRGWEAPGPAQQGFGIGALDASAWALLITATTAAVGCRQAILA